jgi:hypothetical protein
LADSYVVPSTFTIDGQTSTPTQTDNVKYNKPSHELLQFGFVASWQVFRDVFREKHLLLIHNDDLHKDCLFSDGFTAGDYCSVWKHCGLL